jgi:hypothetical protein
MDRIASTTYHANLVKDAEHDAQAAAKQLRLAERRCVLDSAH